MKLNEKVQEIIKTDELQSISSDIAEIVLDSAMDEGLLREIPLLGQ